MATRDDDECVKITLKRPYATAFNCFERETNGLANNMRESQ